MRGEEEENEQNCVGWKRSSKNDEDEDADVIAIVVVSKHNDENDVVRNEAENIFDSKGVWSEVLSPIHFFLAAFLSAPFPEPGSFFSTDLMTPTATV